VTTIFGYEFRNPWWLPKRQKTVISARRRQAREQGVYEYQPPVFVDPKIMGVQSAGHPGELRDVQAITSLPSLARFERIVEAPELALGTEVKLASVRAQTYRAIEGTFGKGKSAFVQAEEH
jgi:hypothetical protein